MYRDDLPFRHYGAHLAGDALELRKGWTPPRIRNRNSDGDVVIELKPAAPCLKMLHPSGTVYEGVFGPGAGRRMPDDPQENRVLGDKIKLGHLPYGVCPKSLGLHKHLPDSLQGGAPCTMAPNKAPISPDNPCACIVEVEAMRKGKQLTSTDQLEARYKRDPERRMELAERSAEAQDKANTMMAESMDRLAAILEAGKKK